MGKAIALGALNSGVICAEDLSVCDLDASKFSDLPKGVFCTTNVDDLANCNVILYAVKPQGFNKVAQKHGKDTVVGSIMAGIQIDTIVRATGAQKVCRVMPNTPCMVGKGMCALTFANCDKESVDFLTRLFSSLGDVVCVDEKLFDAVTCVSGSGPAYVYYFIKSMVDAGVSQGLDYDSALKLTLQTFDGAVQMVRATNKDLSTLIDNVCSPGGTTIQAINRFNEGDLDKIVADGMAKCAARSAELSKELK